MKRIGIDARLYFQTGVGVYIRNLLHFLQKAPPKGYEFYVYVLQRDTEQIEFKSDQFIKIEVKSHWHSLSEQFQFLNILNGDNLDLMHFTYFSYPVLYKKKFISTVHDVTPLVFKTGRASTLHPLLYELKHRSFRYVLSQQIKNASIIITPTKTVKKEIERIYGEKYSKKVREIYEGVNYEIQQSRQNTELSKKFKKPFFLYIGNFYPHKNIETLINAFKEMPQSVELVLVGPNNFFSERVLIDIKQKGIKNIRFYHTGSNEDLVFFYKNAIALVNPSLSEGFGLPLIEAANFDLPIIASDLDVFHELLKDTFISFNSKSSKELHEKLIAVMNNTPHVQYSNILKQYSFKRMSEEIISIYKEQLS